MRIVIDMQGAQNGSKHRGIGRYCLDLTKAIIRNRKHHEVFIVLNNLFPESIDELKLLFTELIPEHHIIIFNAVGPVDELHEDNFWRVRNAEFLFENFIRALSPDIFLICSLFEGACDNTVVSIGELFTEVPVATILYDLIPYLDPEKYIGWDPLKKWYYRKIDSLKKSDLLLGISTSAQYEAIEHLGFDIERTINISSAVDIKLFSIDKNPNVLIKYGIKRKFLMFSSAFDERKNFEGLIKSFSLLPKNIQKNYQLVLVCKIDDTGREVLNKLAVQSGLDTDDLVLTGFVSDSDLVALYSDCHVFVFPSFHEGFGLPVLEAMCCGAAVIGSNTSSIPEVIGRSDALFNPHSIEDMARVIERVLVDEDFRCSLIEHAAIQSKKFSWDQSAQTAIQAFEKIHKKTSPSKLLNNENDNFIDLLKNINSILGDVKPSEEDIIRTAIAIAKNENTISHVKSFADFSGRLVWRVEGPFDSSYSLALLNRETARALNSLGHFCVLHSTEGPGDFTPNPYYLDLNPDLVLMNSRVIDYPHNAVDVASRNLYPPRVEDMASPFNILHHYAWEESGFPHGWVNNFNASLNAITCLSHHVEKILIDNGVSIPMLTSGCGVDHWERIKPANHFELKAKSFRFLHVSSCFPRKGVDLLLDAYGKSFTIKDEVTLIIKTFENPHNKIYQWLAERKEQNSIFPDVVIIEDDLSNEELKALYQSCDVLVAPSCAEGFGLPMAEAMLSGLPVITTAWGGQLDFCNDSNSWLVDYHFERAQTHFGIYSSVWAKIDVDGLSNALTQAYNTKKELLVAKAQAGRELLLENFKWTDVVGKAINTVNTWKSNYHNESNVRIGWVTTWNTKCGIATYSEHLIKNISAPVTIFAPHQESLIKIDDENCIRCWNMGKTTLQPNNFKNAAKHFTERNINTIIIQFNYGFYNFDELSRFIDEQVHNGIVIIVMLHSTSDPYGTLKNWQLIELQPALLKCHRILVHSIHDLNRLKAIGLIDNVALFPHGVLKYQTVKEIRDENKIPLIATYGFCLPHKGLVELVQAIGILKQQGCKLRLRLVNAEFPDPVSVELISQLKCLITELNLDDTVEMNNAFLSDSDSLELLMDANLLVFPYQQTGESSSAAVRYGLASQRPVAVTPLSIFEDIGNAVFHFSGVSSIDIANGIKNILYELSVDSEKAQNIKRASQNWLEQHDYVSISNRLFNMCKGLLRKHPPRSYRFNGSSSQLHSEVGSVQGKILATTNQAGYLIFGPYISLTPGNYLVKIKGSSKENGLVGAYIDVGYNEATVVLGESILNEPDEHGNFVMLPISLDSPCSDLEIRVRVNDQSDLKIYMIEIAPVN
jgi:glycosyltransferase involved in cell wall biosynthesis